MRRLVPVLLLFLVVVPVASAWTWPVRGPVVQAFDFDQAHPYTAGQHRGIAIGANEGTPVHAPAAGIVSFAGTVPGSGRSLTIRTDDGLAVTMTALGSLGVARGATVAEGDEVATAGAEPVHLGVREAANEQGYLDPLRFLPAPPPAASPAPAPSPVPAPAPASVADASLAAPAPAPVSVPSPAPASAAAEPAPAAAQVPMPVDAPAATSPVATSPGSVEANGLSVGPRPASRPHVASARTTAGHGSSAAAPPRDHHPGATAQRDPGVGVPHRVAAPHARPAAQPPVQVQGQVQVQAAQHTPSEPGRPPSAQTAPAEHSAARARWQLLVGILSSLGAVLVAGVALRRVPALRRGRLAT